MVNVGKHTPYIECLGLWRFNNHGPPPKKRNYRPSIKQTMQLATVAPSTPSLTKPKQLWLQSCESVRRCLWLPGGRWIEKIHGCHPHGCHVWKKPSEKTNIFLGMIASQLEFTDIFSHICVFKAWKTAKRKNFLLDSSDVYFACHFSAVRWWFQPICKIIIELDRGGKSGSKDSLKPHETTTQPNMFLNLLVRCLEKDSEKILSHEWWWNMMIYHGIESVKNNQLNKSKSSGSLMIII